MTKELEALQDLSKLVFIYGGVEQYRIIENALKDYEFLKEEKLVLSACRDLPNLKKKLRVLDIIKEKRVNIEYIKCCDTYEQYKIICSYWNEITEEEFNLLKDVLK